MKLTLSTVKVTEQSRMEVLRQCGSCIMALVQKYLADMSTSTDGINSRGNRRWSASADMYSGKSHDPGAEMFMRMAKLSC